MPDPCKPCAPCTPTAPSAKIECPGGEPCIEIYDAKCVAYTGDDITGLGVLKGSRLDDILKKLGEDNGTFSIETEDTASVDLEGNGLHSTPLKALVKLNPDENNLISSTPDGLLTKFDKANILNFFTLINEDLELKAAWCDLIASCSELSCGIITNLDTQIT